MATDALTAFLARDFSRAEEALSELSADNSADLRIRHNALITRFYAQQDEKVVDEFVTFVAGTLTECPTHSKRSFFELAESNPSAMEPLYSLLGPVAVYNTAVIAYVEGYAPAAAAFGALLYANIEAMEDWLALKVSFLLIDVHLRLTNVSTAVSMAAYAERLLPAFTKPSVEEGGDETASSATPPPSEMKLLSPDWPGREKAVLDMPSSYEDAKFCMHVYNARLSAVSDTSRNIRKDAKSAVLAADDSDSRPTSAALLVKARIEQNVSKGLRILMSVGMQSPPNIMKKIKPIALNTLGILHHRLNRHALAACYFAFAREAFLELFPEKAEDESADDANAREHFMVFNVARNSDVCYNLALQHMDMADYERALMLFSIAARADPTLEMHSALLWIRMAECCVALESEGRRDQQLLGVEGQGRGRRFIMRCEEKDEGLGMEYASVCAKAALTILDASKSNEVGSGTSHVAGKEAGPSATASKDGRKEADDISVSQNESQEASLREAALCLLAYSSLSFDPQASLDACDELIALSEAESHRALLGRLYSAEALCLLGRAEEAAGRLAPLLNVNASHVNQYKEAACINIALSRVSNEDMNAASRAAKVALKMTSQEPASNLQKQASFVAAYVFLRAGDIEMARQVLRSLYSLQSP